MASFGGALGQADFQEPVSPDQTSAPQMPQQLAPQTAQGQSLAAALMQRKKKAIGPTVRKPSALAAAISKARRARPGASKFG